MAKRVINLTYRGGAYDYYFVKTTTNIIEATLADKVRDLRPGACLTRKEVDQLLSQANVVENDLTVNIK